MTKGLEKKVVGKLKDVGNFVLSRRFIPVAKGTLAYILAFVLVFLKRFDELSNYPLSFSSMMIIVIASGPGKSVGACVQASALSVAGVSLGCVGFLILAKLSRWPVAQGFVFAIIIYIMALIKSRGPRWFGFSLLCILNCFNGIYTSYLLGGVFNPIYLTAYYESYLWGAAIVLAVNLLVLPKSSERVLRETLVSSLEHVGTFAHLLAKTYTLEITDEERDIRDHLNMSIRADFGYLSQQIEETTIEINYSKFSLKDYQLFVAKTRGLQQALITAHSSLGGVEKQDVNLFRERFLPGTVTAFNNLRRAVDLTIRDLGNELGCSPMIIPMTQDKYNEFMDIELGQVVTGRGSSTAVASESSETHSPDEPFPQQLKMMRSRLAAEVDMVSAPPSRPRTPDISRPSSAVTKETHPAQIPVSYSSYDKGQTAPPQKTAECGMQRLRREFDAFSAAQHDILQESLINGQLLGNSDGELRLAKPMASLRETFKLDEYPIRRRTKQVEGNDGVLKGDNIHGDDTRPETSSTVTAGTENSDGAEMSEDTEKVLTEGQSLIRVWGFLFALEQFVSELEALWLNVMPAGVEKKRRIHIHFFEALKPPSKASKAADDDSDDDLTLPKALALLERKTYTPVQLNFWQHLDNFQQLVQSPTSVYAAKTAAAASVFGTLIYASNPRPWFLNYSLTSGMLTIVVALAPPNLNGTMINRTLGQSILTFVVQIAGSGIGYLWGLAVLEMFRDVGGYTFNPYGIACVLVPYALIMQYLFYEKPSFFVVALLGLNASGVIIMTEWIAVEYLHRPNFDSPALRAGKGLTALTIALAIVAIFQLFILRNPARRTLRKRLAALTYETLSYSVLLQAFAISVLLSSPEDRPSKPALMRVERELRHRELKLQSAVINLTPLMSFAAAEPQFSGPFRRDAFRKIIGSNQLTLDRLREARAALGTEEFAPFILTHFVSILIPYRARHLRLMKTQLYLVASSLQSKAPLPQVTPLSMLSNKDRADFIHDCLVLSARFAKTEEGRRSIRSREFMRYVSFLLCSTAITEPVKVMEAASKELYGELENKLM
ncbi:hypothetical protein K439DRAFT_1660110 [Ramaria rubella]|nr:hypothetical protein K439DRAFT_1660110 [Ramaria rubella]